MKTNRFFNFKRFYRLLSYDLRMNGKRYLSFLAGGIVIFYLILLIGMINLSSNFGYNNYILLFSLSLLGLEFFTGSAFPELSNKIKTGNYLLLPASTFEKTASQILTYVVFGSIFFLLIFWVDAYLAKRTILHIYPERLEATIVNFRYLEMLKAMPTLSIGDKYQIAMSAVFDVSFLFTARLFFKRFAVVKSFIALLAVKFVHSCYMVLFSHVFYPGITNTRLPIYDLTSGISNIDFYYRLFYSLWIFFLPLAYYKLKEKQV